MLLETLDLRTNDVLIYSRNTFNFNTNFKIIYKNEKVKRPRSISYFDVCSYIKNSSPKNLIIYRLLTNVNSLAANSTKYGYFINIGGKVELIYFDPIFAIKDLRHLRFNFDPDRFRFKIQQVGLTSLTKREAEPSFAEVYSFDLKAIEAQNQNDKIYADAIFAFDPDYNDDEYEDVKPKAEISERKIESILGSGHEKKIVLDSKKISEDREESKEILRAVTAPDTAKVQDLREEIIDLLKQALGIPASSSNQADSKNIPQPKPESVKESISPVKTENVFDLFKTSTKSVELSERERESIILKFD
jgi:hypothetical protein